MRIFSVVSLLLLCYVEGDLDDRISGFNKGDTMCWGPKHKFPIATMNPKGVKCGCEDDEYCVETHELELRPCIPHPVDNNPRCDETGAIDIGYQGCGFLGVQRRCMRCKRSCERCGAIDHCSKVTCTTKDNQVCRECKKGYYVHLGRECKKIPSNCLSVTERGSCRQCELGYNAGGGKCNICVAGMWCDGMTKRHCWSDAPEGKRGWCPNEGTTPKRWATDEPNGVRYECSKEYKFGKDCRNDSKCVTARGVCEKPSCWGGIGSEATGFCNSCKNEFAAGKGCEHNVCRDSDLGKQLANKYEAIEAFDFSRYKPEDVQVSQEFKGGGFGIGASFRPISSDLETYRLLIDGTQVSANSPGRPSCSNFQNENVKMPTYLLDDLVAVGDIIQACIRAEWKDSTLLKTSGSWKDQKDGSSRSQPEVCTFYDVKFQTRVIFAVSDVYNSVRIKDTSITFTVGDKRNKYTDITDNTGSIEFDILVEDGVDPGTAKLDLYVTDVALPNDGGGSMADFYLCKAEPTAGVPCHESNRISLPLATPLSVKHLNRVPQKYYIIDNTAVKIDGTILFPSPDPSENDIFCGVEEALVLAIDAKTDELITNTTSDSSGYFEFAVPKATALKLTIMYHGHKFTAFEQNQASIDILSGDGFLVKEKLEGLQFVDTTMHEITVKAAVTDCGYDIGDFTLQLDVPSCPTLDPYEIKAEPNNPLTIQVPAQVYSYDLIDFSGFGDLKGSDFVDAGTVKDRFDFMFPSTLRQFNLTEGSNGINFTYHTEVEVKMNVRNGLHPPETFAESSCSKDPSWMEDPPFDFALKGNSMIDLLFKFHQKYPDGQGTICDNLPEGFTLKLNSLMGQALDPCDTNTGGCYVNVTRVAYQGTEQTLGFGQVISGSPRFNQSSIVDYVGSNTIAYTLFNKQYFDGNGKAGEGSSKILLLGIKRLAENNTVAYLTETQNHIPLLYLYAPPPGQHVQTVTFDLNTELTSQTLALTDRLTSYKTLMGIKIGTEEKFCLGKCTKLLDVEGVVAEGVLDVTSRNVLYSDEVKIVLEGEGLTLSTPEGKFGDDGDMVLLLGTVAYFSESVNVILDEKSCQINEIQSITWGQDSESLIFYSKNDCRREKEIARRSKKLAEQQLQDKSLSAEQREKTTTQLVKAELSTQKWGDLISHWEDDRTQALHHKVDLRKVTNAAGNVEDLNTLTFGASTVGPLTKTTFSSESNIIKYASTGKVKGLIFEENGHVLFGANTLVGTMMDASQEILTTTNEVMEDTKVESESKIVTTTFVEDNAGDKVCVKFYESPHSGTYVFEVCGGSTMCPHIPGTDARQQFELRAISKPLAPLHQQSGLIILELDTKEETFDELDIILELDAETAGLPIKFNIGSASLNQPLEYSIRTGQKTDLYIFFERLDSNLKSVQITGKIRSKCDPSISIPFTYPVEWDSNCPSVNWGGDLAEPDALFAITQKHPDLSLTALNPTSGMRWNNAGDIDVNVVLSYRRQDAFTDSWEILPGDMLRASEVRESVEKSFVQQEDAAGLATLWLSADNNSYFRSGQKYEFELRSECYKTIDGSTRKVGETRSGPRVGIVDYEGPRIVAWKYTPELIRPTLGFPMFTITFNESIDCLNPQLSALIKTGLIEKPAELYCTDDLQQLHVVLQLDSQDDVKIWSEAYVIVEIEGVRDLFENPYEESDSIIPVDLRLPFIHDITSAAKPWMMPTKKSVEAVTKRVNVTGVAIPSSHKYP